MNREKADTQLVNQRSQMQESGMHNKRIRVRTPEKIIWEAQHQEMRLKLMWKNR